MKRFGLVLCVVFGFGMLMPLCAAPDFTGTWVRDNAKSDPLATVSASGKVEQILPEVILTIKHQGNNLQVDTRRSDKPPVLANYNLDGTQNTQPDAKGGADLVYKASWEGDKLIIGGTRKIDTPFGATEIKSKEEWSLSTDGKFLTIITSTVGASVGDFVQKHVYSKQAP